jgi:hypothetical protein
MYSENLTYDANLTNIYFMKWPKPQDKIKAKDVPPDMIYPGYTDVMADAKDTIRPGEEYTVRKCEVYSSWCAVWLEEILDNEKRPDRFFNLSFFDWNYND